MLDSWSYFYSLTIVVSGAGLHVWVVDQLVWLVSCGQVMSLEPMYAKAEEEYDDEISRGLAQVFCTIGEEYIDMVLGEDDVGQVREASENKPAFGDPNRPMWRNPLTSHNRRVDSLRICALCSLVRASLSTLCCAARATPSRRYRSMRSTSGSQ